MPGDLEPRVQRLEDRAAVSNVVIRFAYGLDRADWELYGATLADELFVDFTESTGMEPRIWTRVDGAASPPRSSTASMRASTSRPTTGSRSTAIARHAFPTCTRSTICRALPAGTSS